RDKLVTGVQTCALPILIQDSGPGIKDAAARARGRRPPHASAAASLLSRGARAPRRPGWHQLELAAALAQRVAVQAEHPGGAQLEIGRASCRERGEGGVG